MTSTPYKTRSGVSLYRPTLSVAEYFDADQSGFCLACGQFIEGGVEPDACRYECEFCGAARVYGIQELLLMGLLTISDAETLLP